MITVLTLSFSAAIALSGCSPQDEVRVVKAEAEAAVAKAELARVKAEAEVALLNAKLTAIQAGLSPKDAAAAATIKPNNLEPVENSNERIVGDRSFTELPRFQPLLRLKQPATLADNVSLPPRLTEPKAVVNAPAPAAAAPAAAAPAIEQLKSDASNADDHEWNELLAAAKERYFTHTGTHPDRTEDTSVIGGFRDYLDRFTDGFHGQNRPEVSLATPGDELTKLGEIISRRDVRAWEDGAHFRKQRSVTK